MTMNNIKKKIGRIALVLVICFAGTALSGCFSLQELKDKQATRQSDGSLRVGEYEYIRIEENEYLLPGFQEYKTVYLTDEKEDIPLLLSGIYGTTLEISDDGVIIIDYDDGTCYCRSDYFEVVQEAVNKKYEVKGYKYSYVDTEEGTEKVRILTTEEKVAIDEIFSTVKKRKLKDISGYYNLADVYSFSEPKFFGRYEFEIIKNNNDIYILRYEGKNGEECFYKIPNNKKQIFDDIIKEADDIYNYVEKVG